MKALFIFKRLMRQMTENPDVKEANDIIEGTPTKEK
jgi:hypothetical protein